jgi:hypothetical protein
MCVLCTCLRHVCAHLYTPTAALCTRITCMTSSFILSGWYHASLDLCACTASHLQLASQVQHCLHVLHIVSVCVAPATVTPCRRDYFTCRHTTHTLFSIWFTICFCRDLYTCVTRAHILWSTEPASYGYHSSLTQPGRKMVNLKMAWLNKACARRKPVCVFGRQLVSVDLGHMFINLWIWPVCEMCELFGCPSTKCMWLFKLTLWSGTARKWLPCNTPLCLWLFVWY